MQPVAQARGNAIVLGQGNHLKVKTITCDGILGDQSFGVLVGLHLELIMMIIIVNFGLKVFVVVRCFYFIVILFIVR